MNVIWTTFMVLGSLPCFLSTEMTTAVLNRSSQNLSSVPHDLPQSAEALDLSCNHILAVVKDDFYQMNKLWFLNLSYNLIETIEEQVFQPTQELRILDLSHNKLQSLLGQAYLWMTPNLRYLDLSCNKFRNMTLGSEFSNLGKLKDLGLSAEVIQLQDFGNISRLLLKTLILSVTNLTLYEEGSLRNVVSQKVVIRNISGCDYNILKDALTSFSEVKLVGMTVGRLTRVARQKESIMNTHLELANTAADWKDLAELTNYILASSVKHLIFSDLTLYAMNEGMKVSSMSHVESVTLRRAMVTVFLFSQEMLYDFIINLPVRTLTVTETPIIHMICPQYASKMETLEISDGALSEKVFSKGGGSEPTIECDKLWRLEVLVLRGNNLQDLRQLSHRVSLMSSLKVLDLSQNKLSYQSVGDGCVWPSNITHLNLSSNSLDSAVFLCLPNATRALDLQNNDITVLGKDTLKLTALETLDLTGNRFHDIPDCTAFPNLQMLLIRGNSLQSPSLDFLETCLQLRAIDASNNSFICTCSLSEFTSIAWRTKATNIKLLHWPKAYQCIYPEGWTGSQLENFRPPAVSCNAGLLAVVILIPTVAMFIASALLCRKLDAPWYMGMMLQWARAKHRRRETEDLQGVVFHAFISYSQQNSEWVKGQLIHKLEGKDSDGLLHGLRICYHERDFIPGKTIAQNILLCVEKSRRCVFVLSSDFVQSEWCHYELCFANHQRVANGFNNVILVLLEPLPLYLIPSKYYQLKDMMTRHTYLEWPQERAKQVLFWANLRAVLQADLPCDHQEHSRSETTYGSITR